MSFILKENAKIITTVEFDECVTRALISSIIISKLGHKPEFSLIILFSIDSYL